MAGGGIGEAMIIGAVTGAGTSAVTGGDPLKGALLGAAGGGVGAGVGNLLGGQAAAQAAGATSTAAPSAATGATGAAGSAGSTALAAPMNPAVGLGQGLPLPGGATGSVGSAANQYALTYSDPLARMPNIAAPAADTATTVPKVGFKDLFKAPEGQFQQTLGNYLVQNPMQVGGASGVIGGIKSFEEEDPYAPPGYSGPLSRFRYDPDKYRSAMAGGGLADSAVAQRYMKGGHLGSYSDGGRLLKGPGDGMSDSIPAKIGAKQPARLADGEFVVPADVVSGLGNGSTDAGARKLYAMMDKVRKSRTGTKRQGKEINSNKYLPA